MFNTAYYCIILHINKICMVCVQYLVIRISTSSLQYIIQDWVCISLSMLTNLTVMFNASGS